MNLAIIAFALGVWACQQQSALTAVWVWFLPGVMLVASAEVAVRWHRPLLCKVALVLAAFLMGLSFATWRGELRLSDALALDREGQDVMVTGTITDLPQSRGPDFRAEAHFLFKVDQNDLSVPRLISLGWYTFSSKKNGKTGPPVLHTGQRWQLTVRLKRPHSNFNPNGFDYEAWMFERGIRASGYVRASPDNQLLDEAEPGVLPTIDRWRENIRERFFITLPDKTWTGMLVALVVGDQASISQDQWLLFRQTGITHLVSISGLHVTLIASMLAALVGFIWRRSPRLCLMLPVQKASIAAGALVALFYVALAGFGIPAQRTLYMLAVAGFSLWSGRGSQALRTLLLALLIVLLFDPWAVLAAGFWLSFGAVSALMLISSGALKSSAGNLQEHIVHWAWQWIRAQWAVMLITLPLLLGLFQQFSLISPLANLIAVPLVSMVVTPLALLFAVFPISALAQLAHWLTQWLMVCLEWMAALPIAVWQQAAPPGWLMVLAVIAGVWALFPRGIPGRWIVLLVMVPLLNWSPPRPQEGEMKVTAIDVGQGLSVHVQTAHHDLLFDTGPRYSQNSDSGERVIVPYLRAQGVDKLDAVVVSHNDEDHSGGAESIFKAMPVAWWTSSLSADKILLQRSIVSHDPCQRGQTWEWDGVHFDMLHPSEEFAVLTKENDKSCVLHVKSVGGGVLLPGDIERLAENDLLSWSPESLQADVIVAPHHGSRTSSSSAFVEAANARYVIYTNGYRNRFHHPNVEIVQRYADAGVQAMRSDEDGAVTMDFSRSTIQVHRARTEGARYWHGQ